MSKGSGGRADLLAITGPTASGKTALSLAVARELGGEIVSMDSRQVYRGMDVGTAKATAAERALVRHHGLDLIDPDERYSAGRFARDARTWIGDIRERGRVPILVGGTGFFLRALLDPIFAEPELDEGRRSALRTWMRAQPPERLARWIRRLDPERAHLAVAGGRQRMSRTLEIALLSGRPLSRWHREAPPEGAPLRGVVVVLELSGAELDRRIEARVQSMVREGLVEEVRRLLERGYGPDAPGMTGTGYREVAAHLAGRATLEETVAEVAAATRRYARRQRTWLRHQLPPHAHRVDAGAPLEDQVRTVVQVWRAGAAGRGKGTGRTTDEESL